MLQFLKNESDNSYTENGGKTYRSSGSDCLDLFFKAGASRNTSEEDIACAVCRAYAEDPLKTMKIIFFARDVRGGLGERRFFRAAVKTLAENAPDSVRANIKNFAEYGRYDDLCVLLETPCAESAVREIKLRLDEDKELLKCGGAVSLLAKWLPSVNASSEKTRKLARKLCKMLSMSEKDYRLTLSALRKQIDLIENRMRVLDYSFDYSKQPSGAMFKYRKAFHRHDDERYSEYIASVIKGEDHLNAGTLYPYDIIRKALGNVSEEERPSLEASWRSLNESANGSENSNALAIVDGSASMTWCRSGNIRPIDAAISLGIYFAEHNSGAFKGHFMTFSRTPRLVEVKGRDITEKARYCASFNECSNTDIEAAFRLILNTAVKYRLKPSELPSRLYIISDMEFDVCAEGGNSIPLFEAMRKRFSRYGYALPDIIFWNVDSRTENLPVRMTETGAALVSGSSPGVFDMVKAGDMSPEKIMNDIISSKRYLPISA